MSSSRQLISFQNLKSKERTNARHLKCRLQFLSKVKLTNSNQLFWLSYKLTNSNRLFSLSCKLSNSNQLFSLSCELTNSNQLFSLSCELANSNQLFALKPPHTWANVGERRGTDRENWQIQIQILYFLMPYDTSDNIYTYIHIYIKGNKWASDIRIKWAIDIFY